MQVREKRLIVTGGAHSIGAATVHACVREVTVVQSFDVANAADFRVGVNLRGTVCTNQAGIMAWPSTVTDEFGRRGFA